jgi:bla regulator protein blaR1
MAGWLLYAVAAGIALAFAARLAEHGLVLLGAATRWVWPASMLATVLSPFAAALAIGARAGSGGGGVGVDPVATASSPAGVRLGALHLAGSGFEPWLVAGWIVGSAAVAAVLLIARWLLRRERRAWRSGVVSGERVLLSAGTGPAVVGTVRPCIVLPTWVLGLDAAVQRLIVQHEREHVRAGDSRLLAAGLVLLALLPWCPPLWWQFRRLRLAIEADCDARLLRAGVPPRAYAEALLAVARRRPALLPLTAMAPSRATLERRIRAIVVRRAPGHARRAIVPLTAAALLMLAFSAVPAPPPPSAAWPSAQRGTVPGGAWQPLPDGSLPGDPGAARLAAALARHHEAAIAAGMPPGSIAWFVVDRDGAVRRTGIEQGTEAEVAARVRGRYPAETSELMLGFDDVPAGDARVSVLWLLPPGLFQ